MADSPFSDAELGAYLDESATPEQTAAIEDALRNDAGLRDRLAGIAAQRDAGLHSLGEVWRRRRLTCPSREQLGSHLLGILPEGFADYVRFHLETVGCPLCLASVEDLSERHAAVDQAGPTEGRRKRYFQSSVGRLGGEPD